MDGCREGGGRLSLVLLVSEKPNLVSEMSGKSQGVLYIGGAGNPDQDTHNKLFCVKNNCFSCIIHFRHTITKVNFFSEIKYYLSLPYIFKHTF